MSRAASQSSARARERREEVVVTGSASRRYALISSDGHAGADLLDYKPYLAKELHDEFDVWAAGFTEPWAEYDQELADTDTRTSGSGARRAGCRTAGAATKAWSTP